MNFRLKIKIKNINFFLRFLITLFLLISTAKNSKAQMIKVVDDWGHQLELSHCPKRIISLAPNITEILFALGLNQQIVGVTKFCDYPAEAQTKEIIGGLIDPNLEKIKFLQPDLVLGFRGNPKTLLKKFYEWNLPLAVFDAGKTFEDLFRLIEKIGQITCHQQQASKLILDLNKRIKTIDYLLPKGNSPKKAFLVLSGQGTGLWTCGGDSYLNYLLTKTGLKNVASNLRGNWVTYSREKLIEDNPEIILIIGSNLEAEEKLKDGFFSQSPLKKIEAVKNKNFVFLDENLFSRFGPRLVQAYEQLARSIYPGLFLEEK